jgi:hypothetical protein
MMASREALRTVPASLRRRASRSAPIAGRRMRRVVLPMRMPGMLTGVILALARAIGETAPLITIGASPTSPFLPDGVTSPFTALPIQIFNWVSRPQPAFHVNAAAGIIVLLVLMLLMNGVAIILRTRLPASGSTGDRMSDDSSFNPPPVTETADARRVRRARLARASNARPEGRHDARVPDKQRHRRHRPVGLRQVDVPALPQPHARARPGRARHGPRAARRRQNIYARASTRCASAATSAWSSRSRTRSRRCRSATTCSPASRLNGTKVDDPDAVVERRSPRRPVGRGEGQARSSGVEPVRRPAAAPVHRARLAVEPERHPAGRAVLGARPDRHARIEELFARAPRALHDRHRHPQHAAGRARVRLHGVLLHG